jgi:CHAT domain-containing protein
MRNGIRPVLVALALASCAVPPPSAYVNGGSGDKPAAQIAAGKNAVGEACTLQPLDNRGADIFCGTWQQPSARVREGGAATAAQLTKLVATGPWHAGIEARFVCAAPVSTSVLGGQPALMMQCTQRVGGWPHVAMAAIVGGRVWFADGVLPAAEVMERAIGVRSGVLKANAAPPSSEADALLAQRLAARVFSSGDVGAFDQLMAAGVRANLAENPSAAEAAFRAALAVQQKALGKDNPNTILPLMALALQLSNEGRYPDADALLARAAAMVPTAADATAPARLLHYRGLHLQNQHHDRAALKLLVQADAAYSALVPPDALHARPAARLTLHHANRSLSDLLSGQAVLDPSARAALSGLIEVRRNRAILLQALGRSEQAASMLRSALDLAQGNSLAVPTFTARLYRNSAITQAALGNGTVALTDFDASSAAFNLSLPQSKPLAETNLLRARALVRAGNMAAALPICRSAVASLAALKAGTRPDLMAPCLDAYAAEAASHQDQRDTLYAEMFTAAQLAQGGITSQQIAQATARLQENARDPRVSDAIRRRQEASSRLQDLYRQRDDLAVAQHRGAIVPGTDPGQLDKRIKDAQAALADSDQALQAASPNYGQLVQQVAPAATVLAALRPGEALASFTLSDDEGWVFLLRDGHVRPAKVAGGSKRMADLVRRVRAGIEATEAGVPTFDIAASQELYRATLGGIASGLDGATALVVAPAGPLLSLPFEVLLSGPADAANLAAAPWLVRRFAITHVPAASNFVSLRKVAGGSRATHPWFGFGDFRPVTLAQAERSFPAACADTAKLFASLPPLPYARKELEVARALYGAGPGDELLGPAFTAAAVQRAPLKDYRILHFATHALLPAELRCQSDPAIVTSAPPGALDASGALLTASEVVGLDLDSDLVILSACNSGGPGGGTAGESLSGLARAFFFAGARSLLVSHWAVNDQVGAFLVADTLQRMRNDPALGVAAALRNTELSLLDAAGKGMPAALAQPFYWAPFAAIGDGGGHAATSALRASPKQLTGL